MSSAMEIGSFDTVKMDKNNQKANQHFTVKVLI